MRVLSESPVPENGTPGSMRGVWKRSYGEDTRAPPDERGGKQTNQTYRHRATSLLYSSEPFFVILTRSLRCKSMAYVDFWCQIEKYL